MNMEDDKRRIGEFLKEIGIAPQAALEISSSLSSSYYVSGIPQTVVIDRTGKIQSVHVGFDERTGGRLKAEIEALAGGG